MKKILSLVLTLAMLATMCVFTSVSAAAEQWNGQAATAFSEGDGTAATPYKIGSAAELKLFANIVNGDGGQTQDKTVCGILTADIVLNAGDVSGCNGTKAVGWYEWTPIGTGSEYLGTFNGDGHTVSGVYVNTTTDKVGFFGTIGAGATASNLGVVNSYIKGNQYVGGVCGNMTHDWDTGIGGTVIGCYNTGTVSGNNLVGGVCGFLGGLLQGCYNTGAISGNTNVGGILGSNFIARVNGCYNIGTVSGNTNVGGVVGYSTDGIFNSFYLDTCVITETTPSTYGTPKTADEMKTQAFTDTLNANGGDFVFYCGKFPAQSWQKNEYGTAVTYTVESIYFVDIPAEVTLGGELSVSASGVILEEGKQLNIALTGTSEADDTFKVTNGGTGVLEYTVTNGNEPEAINSTVLTVNPKDGSTGDTTLKFNAPTDTPKYSGSYTGTVTFTVSVTDQPTEFFLATDYYKNDTIALYCAPGTTWEEWIESADNIYGMQKDEEHIAIYGSSGVVDEDAFILCSASMWDVAGGMWERSRLIGFVDVIKEITYVLVPASELMG